MSKAADLALLAGGADTLTDTTNTGSVTLDFSQYQNFILTFTGNVTLYVIYSKKKTPGIW